MSLNRWTAYPLALALLGGLTACSTTPTDPATAPEMDRAESASTRPAPEDTVPLKIASDVEERLERFAPTELSADLSALSDEDRRVLHLLVEAARYMDQIFLRQAGHGYPEMRARLAAMNGAEAQAALDYFDLNFGPYDRLDEMESFVTDATHSADHSEGAGYYPAGVTKAEIESWITAHPEQAEAFRSLHTVIRRTDDGALEAVPYSEAYRQWLVPAAEKLREAAAATSNASLKRFLTTRAAAFQSDDYFESDLAWMDLDAPVEVTIGPYETYEDGWFGYKAAFEAFVTVNLPEESAALARYKDALPWLERNLPIPDEHKNFDRGTESPIRVVDEVFTAGDTKAGVQTLAFNLPNDERVREAKGSKKVLLRNIMRAKYDRILLPIADRVLDPEQRENVDFDAYFDFILHHELSHGLGPGVITKDGRETEVRLELKDHYSTLEEAKADVMGVYNILSLINQGEMDEDLKRTLLPTYVAGLFRSVRFGLGEAHGQGVAAQFNYLLEAGALEVDERGRFSAVPDEFAKGIENLLHEMLMLQALGDYDGTAAFLDKYGQATPALRKAVDRLEDVPVDVKPIYVDAR